VISLCSSVPESVRRFKTSPWPYEKTLVTPRKDLVAYLSALLELFPTVQGDVSTDEIVFEPDNLLKFLTARGISLDDYWSFCGSVSGAGDVQEMLAALLNDWIDFAFVPSSESFAIYADHDEFLTIYFSNEADLDRCFVHLRQRGFGFVEGYTRPSGYLKRNGVAGSPPPDE
jgi:hypothetical protein